MNYRRSVQISEIEYVQILGMFILGQFFPLKVVHFYLPRYVPSTFNLEGLVYPQGPAPKASNIPCSTRYVPIENAWFGWLKKKKTYLNPI